MLAAHQHLKNYFTSCEWFAALSVAHQKLVVSTASEITTQPGECVARAGDACTHWFGVIYGFLKMHVTDTEGNETILYCLCKDEWGGEGTLLKKEVYRYSAVAMTPSVLCVIPAQTFEQLYAESLPFNHFLLSNMNTHLGTFIGILQAARFCVPEHRVAKCLVMLTRGQLTRSTPLSIRQHDLALICGLSRQRTNVALQALRCKNLIRTHRQGQMTINLPAIEEYLSSVPATAGRDLFV